MDVIKITPEELRDMAQTFRDEEDRHKEEHSRAVCVEDRQWAAEKHARARIYRKKLVKLAAKLEADNLDALAFCAPAQGVQA